MGRDKRTSGPFSAGDALGKLRELPSGPLFLMAIALAITIGALDWVAHPQVILSTLYLLPIVLMSWTRGFAAGIVMSVLDLAIMLWLELESKERPATIVLVNASVRSCLFVFVSFLVSKLSTLVVRLTSLSLVDNLTGLANARAAHEAIERVLALASRTHSPFSVFYLDVDHFKRVNDERGHAAGDDLLRRIGAAMSGRLRRTDIAARMGGDEFFVLLADTAAEGAATFAESLRTTLLLEMARTREPVTFSIGGVTFVRPPNDPASLLNQVDAAMYRVKHAKRDGIHLEVYPGPLVDAA